MNKPRYPINTTPEILSLPQKDINSKGSVRKIIESKTFHDNISEKIKIESLKTETNFFFKINYFFFVSESIKHNEK